jgi:hypothetical protein
MGKAQKDDKIGFFHSLVKNRVGVEVMGIGCIKDHDVVRYLEEWEHFQWIPFHF